MSDLDPGVPVSLSERLKLLLSEYRGKAQEEVDVARRIPLQLHRTALQVYERQIELIDDLLDALEEGEEIIS